MKTKEIVASLDLELRHKLGMTSDKFIKEYCKVFREHASATRDDSLNEFEKEITHVLGMLIYYKRFCELIGFKTKENRFDPRDIVQAYEDSNDTYLVKNNFDYLIESSDKHAIWNKSIEDEENFNMI